jgi:nucleotide-binding universal stress UspA family protein
MKRTRGAVTLQGYHSPAWRSARRRPPSSGTDRQPGERRLSEDSVNAAAAEARLADPGVRVEPLVVGLGPVDALIETAQEHAARVIVVGSTGELPIVGAILGSVPRRLLHRAQIPVLVVPHPD